MLLPKALFHSGLGSLCLNKLHLFLQNIYGQYSCHKKVCCAAKSVVCPKKGIDRLSRASLLTVARPLVEVKGTAISGILFTVCFKTDYCDEQRQ